MNALRKFLIGSVFGFILLAGYAWQNEAEAVLKSAGGFSGGTVPNASNFSSAVGFADGTVTDPSIAWTSDQDGSGTGFYRSAANEIGVAVNGVQQSIWRSGGAFYITPATAQIFFATGDAVIAYATTNSLRFGTSNGSTITSRTEMNKAVASIADNVATATFTITIPNAAHSASMLVTETCALGAGGAIGAGEATGTISYNAAFARTAGVAAVGTLSTGYGSATSSVAGAATITTTGALSTVSGAVGATNTFTFNVTVARGTGSSTNHTCTMYARLMNQNATGITIS